MGAIVAFGDPCSDLDNLLGLRSGTYAKGQVCHALFWQGARGASPICVHSTATKATCPATNPVLVTEATSEVSRLSRPAASASAPTAATRGQVNSATTTSEPPTTATTTPASTTETETTVGSIPVEILDITTDAPAGTTSAPTTTTVVTSGASVVGVTAAMRSETPFVLEESIFEASTELSLVVLGDVGHANRELRQTVHMVHEKVETESQAVLLLGDNFYPRGVTNVTDSQFVHVFEEILAAGINLPFYPILGNHDWLGNAQAQIEYSQVNDRWIFPSLYYLKRFVGADFSVCVFALNTEKFANRHGNDEAQLAWLRAALAEHGSDCTWRIVMGHHPVFDAGEYRDNARLIERLLPILNEHRVHLYLAGHEHQSQVLYNPQRSPVTFIVTGCTAELRSDIRKTDHPFFVWSEAQKLGFLQLVASRTELRYKFHRSTGGIDAVPTYEGVILPISE